MPFLFAFPTRLAAPLLALGLLASACGDATTDTASGSVEGREFWSTAVTVDGEPYELVEGTRIQLRFDEGTLGAGAGCNNLGGDYTLDGDTLAVGGMFMTEMGCDPALHAQDDVVVQLLTASPVFALDADTLTLTTESITATFLDREVADPDQPLLDTTWEVTGFFDEVVAWSHAVDRPATLRFTESELEVVDACGTTTLVASYDGTAQVALTAPDRWPACEGETPEPTSDLRSALEGGTLRIEIDGPGLRLAADGAPGITAIARR